MFKHSLRLAGKIKSFRTNNETSMLHCVTCPIVPIKSNTRYATILQATENYTSINHCLIRCLLSQHLNPKFFESPLSIHVGDLQFAYLHIPHSTPLSSISLATFHRLTAHNSTYSKPCTKESLKQQTKEARKCDMSLTVPQ